MAPGTLETYAQLHVVALHVGPDAAAQVVRGHGLADAADVVALAFHGGQRGAVDGGRIDAFATHEAFPAERL